VVIDICLVCYATSNHKRYQCITEGVHVITSFVVLSEIDSLIIIFRFMCNVQSETLVTSADVQNCR
jgi:hypothetical protein